MGHVPTSHRAWPDLDAATAATVAATLQALAHPGRLRILTILQKGPQGVGRLAEALAFEQSALSHQLRVLREQGFVVAERSGRNVEYRLHDSHIGELIEQALSHAEHIGTSGGEQPASDVSQAG